MAETEAVAVPRSDLKAAAKALAGKPEADALWDALQYAPAQPATQLSEMREKVALHPETADLVDRFAGALKEKLAKAEAKYGYSDGWLSDDWRADLVRDLASHVQKGDPRDVAAYCAFAWHHGWSIAEAPSDRLRSLLDEAINLLAPDQGESGSDAFRAVLAAQAALNTSREG